ncbi:hypothetical protein WJX81_003858 [Elliptochloris bilobata]|uniref:Uncharacterized protein n=1 Tax=Elliptochloris bilobata TaxID=381761 RepID=A0AAW1SFT3_9CHLO
MRFWRCKVARCESMTGLPALRRYARLYRPDLCRLGLPAELSKLLASGGASGVYGLSGLLVDSQSSLYTIDMSTAVEEAALCNARVVHLDRSQGVTLLRLAVSLSGSRALLDERDEVMVDSLSKLMGTAVAVS